MTLIFLRYAGLYTESWGMGHNIIKNLRGEGGGGRGGGEGENDCPSCYIHMIVKIKCLVNK